jgi:hypothetical protein
MNGGGINMPRRLGLATAFLTVALAFIPTAQAKWHSGAYLGPPIYGPYGPYYPGYYRGYYPGPYPGFYYPGWTYPGYYPGWHYYHHHEHHHGHGHK